MIKSCSKHDNKFISLLFFMYNITDTLGKYLSYYFQEYSSSILYSIQIVSVIRLIFIPIFLSFQNIVTDPSDIEINCNSCSVCMNVFPVIAISLLGLRYYYSHYYYYHYYYYYYYYHLLLLLLLLLLVMDFLQVWQ